MSELEQALASLSVPCQVGLSGRWAKLAGRCPDVYVVRGAWEEGYVVVCGCPQKHPARRFLSAQEAVADALGWVVPLPPAEMLGQYLA